MGAVRWGFAVGLVVVLALLGTLPTALALPAPAAPPSLPVSTPAPTLALPTGSAAHPAPPVSCPNGYPGYGPLPGTVWPLDPNFAYQGPCHFAAVDEVHASFASGAAGSGERWTIPWTLPAQGAGGQQNVEDGLYLGMVVAGDPTSAWNQSYFEVMAEPVANSSSVLNWTVQVGVLSFANASTFGFNPVGCPRYSYNLSWNDSYFCEFDDLPLHDPIQLLTGLPAASALAVTFDGATGGKSGLDLWVNETSGNLTSAFLQLNATTTGTYAFEPAFSSACAQSCFLAWGLSYGLGAGVDICPWAGAASPPCDSYNGSAYAALPPVTYGAPEYWNGTAYGGDYRYFQPESASGVCDTNPPVGVTTAPCFEFANNGGNGFYPYFTLTGTGLTFGRTYAASVTTYGGAYGQYLDTPGTQDLIPFVETDLSDSSLAGFVAPGGSVNVSVNVTDLGTIDATNLAWSLNGSAWTTSPLTGTGTASALAYVGTIPSGANGPLHYQVNATNSAGLTISSSVRTVLRGPLPSFSVGLGISPGNCGSVDVGGTDYRNGSAVMLGPGPVPVSATGCYPYNFTVWQVTPGLSVAPSGASAGTLTVGASGNVTADFTYVRPTEDLSVHVSPTGCGEVVLDGTNYSDGEVAPLSYGLSHSLSATVVCSGYAFGGWAPGPNVTVLGNSIIVLNNSTLTAEFSPTSETYPVSFATNPVTCGGVGLDGAGYTTGQTVYLASGSYSLNPDPCPRFGFENFTTRGGVGVSGSTLTVAYNGTVIENNFALTEAYVQTDPAGCGGILLDGTSYSNGVYVPLQNHSAYTVTAFTCDGHYLDAFSASGGLSLAGSLLTVNGSGLLLVVSLPGTASIFVGFVTTPASCGGIDLNGTEYSDGAFVSLPPDVRLSISATPCSNYGVVGWAVTGQIAIVGNEAFLNGSGAITAVFGALVPILFETVPSTCGATLIEGVPYADGASATLINGKNYSIAPDPCAHYELELFESSPYVAIQNSSIAPDGPSTITAVFEPVPYAVATTVIGPGCGSVTLAGARVGSGGFVNLTAGSYPLTESPCVTSTFAGFTVSANLSVAAGMLVVNGSGSLVATFLLILPSVSLGGSAGDYVGGTALFYAVVQVPLAVNGYSYLWNFGDGTTNVTTSNTTTHVFERTGTFTVSVEVTDPYHHTGNATLTLTVVGQPSTNYGSSLTTGLAVLGAAAIVLVVVALLARRRAPPPRAEPDAREPAEGISPVGEPPASPP